MNSEFIFDDMSILKLGDNFEKTKYLDGRIEECLPKIK